MQNVTRAAAFIVTLCIGAFATTEALASGSSVAPTRLVFAKGQPSSYVVITNTTAMSQRYSVSAYGWDETATNPITLSATSSVVYFPGSFTIDPGQSQRIRVGTTAGPSDVERTYRLIVSELPALKSVLTPQSNGLTFTQSFSIPVYVTPAAPVAGGEIGSVSVDREKLRFTVRNTGNVHLVAKSMRVSARGESGAITSFENSAWFVLAKNQREFTVPIPAGSCAAVKSVSISVDAEKASFERTVNPERSCG